MNAHSYWHTTRAAAISLVAALTLGACTASVTGRGVRAPTPAHSTIRARDLLLRNGDTTPLGAAAANAVGNSYFTSARPPECAPALLFKGSPLPPAGASDHAESAYTFGGKALYAESVDLYDKALNTQGVARNGFSAVSNCHGDAIGVSPSGESPTMRLSFIATPADGVLVWTMTRPDWTCDYGLVVIAQATLMLSACDTNPGFPMPDWASKRRAQLNGRSA
ncbi:MAG: hypothetical protein WBZ37_01125 [Mycobacterium sp.]